MIGGMNVARLNFSHSTQAEHKEKMDRIKKLRKKLGIPVAILLDTKGPAALPEQKALSSLGDFSIKDAKGAPRMAVTRGHDRAAMFEQGVNALGGMEMFIAKGDRVLIKVNAAFASPALMGATTHPELLGAVIGACKKAGAAQVSVTDNPINNPENCFEITGLAGAARRSGASIILPRVSLFTPATLPDGRLIINWPVFAGAFTSITKVIALAPVKDHTRAGASMLLKNMYGLLGGRRNVFHQDINTIITEVGLLMRPTLSVLDGTVSMMTNGPTGGSLSDLKETNTLIISRDPVAADAYGLTLLGRAQDAVPYIRMAQDSGAGTADYKSLNPISLDTGA
jgi:uncharacterized protein (DUF362 family)